MNEPADDDPLEEWLRRGRFCVGEIAITHAADGSFALCHRDDEACDDLVAHGSAEAAAEIVRYDDAGGYRPLKTAPTLRHGWRLFLSNAAAVREALDAFYPGRLAAYSAFCHGRLLATPLRETLARQSGMYRAAAKISDEGVELLVADFCRSDGGCLRTILWSRDAAGEPASRALPPSKFDPEYDQIGMGDRAVPLLCQEACNLLVAQARKVVKGGE